MVRSNEEMVSDAKVREATGHGRDHWFGVLDAYRESTTAGAADPHRAPSHTDMAAHLVDHGVDAWWAQGITVAYEQARGLRMPGQRPDGSFDASASKTLSVALDALWPHLVEDDARAAWLPGWELTGQTPGTSVRLRNDAGHKATLNFYGSTAATADGSGGKTKLAAQISGLADADEVAATKVEWKAALTTLASLA